MERPRSFDADAKAGFHPEVDCKIIPLILIGKFLG